MTTGEKLALLRKKKGITQEELAELLQVSRQSVSRWEMDVTFPETDKLIKLSRMYECSIDFLLNENLQEKEERDMSTSIEDCYQFIRDCGYFFLATSVDNQPKLRPFGMIYTDGKSIYFATDKRKSVFTELKENSNIELASYNPRTHRWIRIEGTAELDTSLTVREAMMNAYPMLRQKYSGEEELFLAIYKIQIENLSIS